MKSYVYIVRSFNDIYGVFASRIDADILITKITHAWVWVERAELQ